MMMLPRSVSRRLGR